jgi:Uma2 family endonuclease
MLVYFDASVIPRSLDDGTSKRAQFIDGCPTLAIEVVDQSDHLEAITELVDAAMEAGIPLLWLVDPVGQYVEMHRPNCGSIIIDQEEDLSAFFVGPALRFPVSALFE